MKRKLKAQKYLVCASDFFTWSVFQTLGHETPFDVRSILLVNGNIW